MTQVFVLGAGTPTPTPDRWGSAFAVDVGGEYLMFECGPAATAKLVKVGILPTRVDYLFFTHHHGNDKDARDAPGRSQKSGNQTPDKTQPFLQGFDEQPDQPGKERPQQNGFPFGAGKSKAPAYGHGTAAQRGEDFVGEGNVEKCGRKHGGEINKGSVDNAGRFERGLDFSSSASLYGFLAEKRLPDRFPMFDLSVAVACRTKNRRRNKKRGDDDGEHEDYHREDKQLFVPRDNGDRTLE